MSYSLVVPLTYVALAGIIQHHSTDTEVVPFVKKLTELYIKNKNTLIVVAVPMTGRARPLGVDSMLMLFH